MTGERISNGEATGASATGSLGGITVVDLSRVLGGPYATQMLGDHGARVLKIEPPQGDETRAWGPPFYRNGIAWYYAGVNRNKEVRTLDLRTDAGQAQLRALLAEADVLVENFKPGTLEKWGLGYDVLSVEFPRLVHCSVTGFGEDGPLGGMPGYDAVAQAMSGLMSVNGTPESGPTRIGMPAVDMITGLNAVNGIMMALWERGASGRGQRVETTLFDCALSVMHPHMPNFFGTGQPAARTGNDHPNIAPYSTYATGEGDLFIAVGNDRQFARLCERIGVPQLVEDARFATNADRSVHRDEMRAELEAAMLPFEAVALGEALMADGVPAGPILDSAQAAAHPHTAHREMIIEMEDGYRGVASPVKLSRTPATYRISPGGADAVDQARATSDL